MKIVRWGIWTAQVLAFLAFGLAGLIKLFMPISHIAAMWPWAGDLPPLTVRVLGFIDLAGGVGILLPALTRILPGLTVLAALGCICLQLCAMIFHASRGEFLALPVNVVLLALSIVIFWGRRKFPIKARQALLKSA